MPSDGLGLSHLPDSHRERLEWFAKHRGQEVPFPEPLPGGLHLATRAKGIYKPAGIDHALSVRVMISSPYADKAVDRRPDGSWSLDYFQENPDPGAGHDEYTNRAMVRCITDQVPVGVLYQTQAEPARYEVLGLAIVTGWSSGFFRLESC